MTGIYLAGVVLGLLLLLLVFYYVEWLRWDEDRRLDRQELRDERRSCEVADAWFDFLEESAYDGPGSHAWADRQISA